MKARASPSSAQLARQLGFARAMRREPTALSIGFRRQAVVAGCHVDFVAPSRLLIVEVDGGYHSAPGTAGRTRAGTAGSSAPATA